MEMLRIHGTVHRLSNQTCNGTMQGIAGAKIEGLSYALGYCPLLSLAPAHMQDNWMQPQFGYMVAVNVTDYQHSNFDIDSWSRSLIQI